MQTIILEAARRMHACTDLWSDGVAVQRQRLQGGAVLQNSLRNGAYAIVVQFEQLQLLSLPQLFWNALRSNMHRSFSRRALPHEAACGNGQACRLALAVHGTATVRSSLLATTVTELCGWQCGHVMIRCCTSALASTLSAGILRVRGSGMHAAPQYSLLTFR